MKNKDDLKICVYAICKNESKFIKRWYNAVKEADYIVVLDTGSTDNSIELLKECGVTRVEQKIYDEFRFDTARNDSLKLIPEDTDICYVSDLDQVVRPGWSDIIKDLVSQGYDVVTGDIVNYNQDGSESSRYESMNVHPNKPEWYWERPIHEGIIYHGEYGYNAKYSKDFIIDHLPDKSKDRSLYLTILRREYETNSTDPYCAIYYANEEYNVGDREKGFNAFLTAIDTCDFTGRLDVKYQIYLNLSEIYEERLKDKDALKYALRAESECNIKTRYLYMSIAKCYKKLFNYPEAISYILKALRLTERNTTWIERVMYWNDNYCTHQLIDIYRILYDKTVENPSKCYMLRKIINLSEEIGLDCEKEKEALFNISSNVVKYIIVYAICKNEEKNLYKWHQCVKGADEIIVVDTGSTDSTIERLEKLKSEYSNFNYFTYEIPDKYIDFGEARNVALNHAVESISNNYDYEPILVSLDLDEFLEEDGIEKIRDNWDIGIECMDLIGHTEGVGNQIVSHKIHNKFSLWKRSMHEITIDAFTGLSKRPHKTSDITYTHRQDLSKDRNYYDLCKNAYDKNPTDIKNNIYLAWECYNNNLLDDYRKYNESCLELLYNNISDEYYMDAEYIMQCYLNLYNYSKINNNSSDEVVFCEKVMDFIYNGKFATYRRAYFSYADALFDNGQHERSIEYYLKCLNISARPYCWIDDDLLYTDNGVADIYNRIALCYFYKQDSTDTDLEIALEYTNKAIELIPDNELYLNNKNLIIRQIQKNARRKAYPVNKVCVYAICKNESQFIEQWYESMREADNIVVLDTGSTDNTVNIFKEKYSEDIESGKLIIDVKLITPWRFDTARNESLKLCPPDCNILISTDLDELLEPGWAQVLRDNWIEGVHERAEYKYAWSHLPNGEPGRVFRYNKIHSRHWIWKYPVHELLWCPESHENYYGNEGLDLFDKIFLHHYPDEKKSRGSYLPLLELRAEESVDDWYGLIYLAHEYSYRGMYEKSINLLKNILTNYNSHYGSLEQASCYLFIGDGYNELNDYDKAIDNYLMAIQIEPTYREPYCNLAKVLEKVGQYDRAEYYLKLALKKTYQHFTWLERDLSWTYELYDLLVIAAYYSGNKKDSIAYAAKALSFEPDNLRLQQNLTNCINSTSDLELV